MQTREEGFIGWYHSHPFDVGTHSNAFLSATDVSTQLGWQLPEDRAGIPWLALVVRACGGRPPASAHHRLLLLLLPLCRLLLALRLSQVDPLRGVAKGKPEIGAFRCYPPAYTPPKGTAPDGVVWGDEKARNARWGDSCVSYYQVRAWCGGGPAGASWLAAVAQEATSGGGPQPWPTYTYPHLLPHHDDAVHPAA